MPIGEAVAGSRIAIAFSRATMLRDRAANSVRVKEIALELVELYSTHITARLTVSRSKSKKMFVENSLLADKDEMMG